MTKVNTARITKCQSNVKNTYECNEKRDSIVVDHV